MINITEYKELIDRFYGLMKSTRDISSRKITADKWTLKEMVGHLIDSASNNHQRFVRLQLNPVLHFPAYEAEQWNHISRVNSCDFDLLVNLWNYYNGYLLHIIENIDKGSFGNYWEFDQKKVTLEELVKDYYGHIKIHETLYKDRIEEINAATGSTMCER